MPHTVELTEEAAEQIASLPRKSAMQIVRRIEGLAANPRPAGARRLVEHGHLYRVRSGDYRILYQIEDSILRVLVVKVGNRRDVYRSVPPPRRRSE